MPLRISHFRERTATQSVEKLIFDGACAAGSANSQRPGALVAVVLDQVEAAIQRYPAAADLANRVTARSLSQRLASGTGA